MAAVETKVKFHIAWWVRPSLYISLMLSVLAQRWINLIVDRGIKAKPAARSSAAGESNDPSDDYAAR